MLNLETIKKGISDFINAKEVEIYGKIHMLPTGRIYPNPNQPRKNFEDEGILRLADSIKKFGILQPITVRLAENEKGPIKFSGGEAEFLADHYYEIVAGERRLRAAKIAGLREVPCIIIDADNRQSAELAIIENIQRENLNIFEQAGAIASLIDIYGLTQEQAAKILCTTQSCIANRLRILKLTPKERRLIVENNLTERHARALLKLSDPDIRTGLLETIISREMNVPQTEAFIDKELTSDETPGEMIRRRRIVIKDIRMFYNTIDRAVNMMEQAGVNVTREKHDSDDSVEYVIKIKKRYENDEVS